MNVEVPWMRSYTSGEELSVSSGANWSVVWKKAREPSSEIPCRSVWPDPFWPEAPTVTRLVTPAERS
jgi:hypothetical protein